MLTPCLQEAHAARLARTNMCLNLAVSAACVNAILTLFFTFPAHACLPNLAINKQSVSDANYRLYGTMPANSVENYMHSPEIP